MAAKTPPDQVPATENPDVPVPETLDTLAARLDHLDSTLHSQLAILTEVRAQLVQVDDKQNGAAGLLQSIHEGVHKLGDLIAQHQPLLDHAAKFLDSPVTSYLAGMKDRKDARHAAKNNAAG